MATVSLVAAVLAAVVAPAVVVWLLLITIGAVRGHRGTGLEVVAALGCGLAAAGAASLLLSGIDRLWRLADHQRLAFPVPVLEETLKALAIVVAVGVVAVRMRRPLPLRGCGLATVSVVAGFAVGENLGHLVPHLLAYAAGGTSAGEVAALLRVRGVLPPLGHAAETWPVGAALWLASRCPGWRRWWAVMLAGLLIAVLLHAAWNVSALAWWPNPLPLVSILAVAVTGAGMFAWLARGHERAERAERPERADQRHRGATRLGGTPAALIRGGGAVPTRAGSPRP